MDDDDLKIRKNLVLVSAVVILTMWLEIPFSAFAAKLIGPEYATPSEHKIWIVGLAILCYFAARYRFTDDGVMLKSSVGKEAQSMRKSLAHQMGQHAADYYTKTGKKTQVFGSQLDQFTISNDREKGSSTTYHNEGRATLTLYPINDDREYYKMVFSVHCSWSSVTGSNKSSTGNAALQFDLMGLNRQYLLFRPLIHASVYSRATVLFAAPVVLALIATFVICGKILQAYISTSG